MEATTQGGEQLSSSSNRPAAAGDDSFIINLSGVEEHAPFAALQLTTAKTTAGGPETSTLFLDSSGLFNLTRGFNFFDFGKDGLRQIQIGF